MRLKFATAEIHGEMRITFSREEILAMNRSAIEDKNISSEAKAGIIVFLNAVEAELLKES